MTLKKALEFPDGRWWNLNMLCSLSTVARLTTLLWLLPAGLPLSGQTPDWRAGIAQIAAKGKSPGTGFVVALRPGRAYLVTCAHVVEGDPNPAVVFLIDADKNRSQARVQDVEGGDPRGLALLVADNPPAGLLAITPKPDGALMAGAPVTAAGFPSAIGAFTVLPATVASVKGRDLFLTPETGEGFSGGPVLQDGIAVGVIYGREGGYGKAVPVAQVELYLRGLDVKWGAQAAAPVELSPGTVRTNPADGQSYVWIPPGSFLMGCSPGDQECRDNEKPAHRVRISKGFWVGQTEVTQSAYERVMGNNPGNSKGPQQPVEQVAWNDADAHCKAAGGRLPTEAEWEYAARAGSTAARYGKLDAIAWCSANSGKSTKPVRTKQPNAWGLYDMLGNVSEWCQDWYGPYQSSEQTDPQGPPSGNERVVRGGSWLSFPWSVRVSYRGSYQPEDRVNYIGFRCVREVIP